MPERALPRGLVDLHNHVLPGVDDGAIDIAGSRSALDQFTRDGVVSLVATPHIEASLVERPQAFAARMAELDAAWSVLVPAAHESHSHMQIARGAEVMLDTPTPDLSDARIRLAGGPFALVEFPYMSLPPHAAHAVVEIRKGGWNPVVAHPERYHEGEQNLPLFAELREAGAFFQANGASFTGRYGERARDMAWRLLSAGMLDCVASDYHTRGPTGIPEYLQALAGVCSEEQLQLLVVTNPGRFLAGDLPVPVGRAEAKKPNLWARLTRARR